MQRSQKDSPAWRAPAGRWSPTDGAAMVAAFEASGLSMRAFAAKHGVRTHRVAYWRSQTSKTGAVGSASGFVRVAVAAAPAAGDEEQVLEVSLRSGRSLRVRGRWSEAAIRTWIRALEASS